MRPRGRIDHLPDGLPLPRDDLRDALLEFRPPVRPRVPAERDGADRTREGRDAPARLRAEGAGERTYAPREESVDLGLTVVERYGVPRPLGRTVAGLYAGTPDGLAATELGAVGRACAL